MQEFSVKVEIMLPLSIKEECFTQNMCTTNEENSLVVKTIEINPSQPAPHDFRFITAQNHLR